MNLLKNNKTQSPTTDNYEDDYTLQLPMTVGKHPTDNGFYLVFGRDGEFGSLFMVRDGKYNLVVNMSDPDRPNSVPTTRAPSWTPLESWSLVWYWTKLEAKMGTL